MTNPMPRTNYVDVSEAMQILDNTMRALDELHGTEITDDGKNNAENRETNSRLLFLAEGLSFASSLIRMEYWTTKGREL